MTLPILNIVEGTCVDGPGLRTSFYIAGCRHRCPGCHNPGSWNDSAGCETSIDSLVATAKENDFDVTLSGGDPLYHPKEVEELCRRIKQELGKSVWCYTGFTWEELTSSPSLLFPLRWIDTVVEGRFVEQLRDTKLRFRGSSNQRIIDVAASLRSARPVERTEYYKATLAI